MRVITAVLIGFSFFVTGQSSAADKAMTGDELSALLANGKTIHLGGKGTGYSGELTLNADGTGAGSAQTDDGKKHFKIEGTWEIRDGAFCRVWHDLDDGKDVCETWVKTGPRR